MMAIKTRVRKVRIVQLKTSICVIRFWSVVVAVIEELLVVLTWIALPLAMTMHVMFLVAIFWLGWVLLSVVVLVIVAIEIVKTESPLHVQPFVQFLSVQCCVPLAACAISFEKVSVDVTRCSDMVELSTMLGVSVHFREASA